MIATADGGGGLDIGGIRYMMIRPDALMGLFRRLEPAERAAAFEAIAASILEHGGKSAASYAGHGRDAADALISRIEATAPQIGWGNWQISLRDDGLDLTVVNSPFVAGYGPSDDPVCAPIRGMLAAVTHQIFGDDAMVTEIECAATGSADACRFTARLSAAGINQT